MKKSLLSITIMAALIIGVIGCSSIDSRTKGSQSGLYPGVKAGTEDFKNARGFAENSVAIIDLPFSFALDTVLLPFDLLGVASKGKDDNNSTATPPTKKP